MTVAAGDDVEVAGGETETRSGGAGDEVDGEGGDAGVSGLPKKAKGYLRKSAV
jgi:hypothetical protein